MKGLRVVAVLGCLVAVMAAISAAEPGSAPAKTKSPTFPVAPAAVADKNLEVLWKTELRLEGDPPVAELWLCGKFLLGRGQENRLYGVNAATGVRLWEMQAAEPFQKVWPPAVDKDTLWIPTTTRLIGVNGNEGNLLEAIPLDFCPTGRAVTNGVHCYMPDAKGWLQAVSLQPKTVPWGRWTESSLTASPVLGSSLVFFAGHNGTVYASHQNVRHVVWDSNMVGTRLDRPEGAIVADLKQTKAGLVLAASLDYRVYAYRASNGTAAWVRPFNAGEPIRKPPYAVGNQVFVFTQEAGLRALDATNGKVQWALADGTDLASADADAAYIVGRESDLLAVGRRDGKVRFRLSLRPGAIVATNETEDGVVYLAVPTGEVMAIAKKTAPAEKKAEPALVPVPGSTPVPALVPAPALTAAPAPPAAEAK